MSLAVKQSKDDPEAQAATQAASTSEDVLRAVEVLTGNCKSNLRGCPVNPDRPHLQALQNVVGWTLGGYDTRPTPAAITLKERDRLEILLRYRQPVDPGLPPRVAMYDYLCDSLFGVPMRPVGSEVAVPTFLDLDGRERSAEWVEADWDKFRQAIAETGFPGPVFRENRYPYQLPRRIGSSEFERSAQHWVLWYLHLPGDALPDPSDAEIDRDVRSGLSGALAEHGLPGADYIWYRNPAMSVPEVFHVQVFWIVPAT